MLFNPWVFWQYVHTMGGAVVTGAFAMAALGAFYVLTRQEVAYGKMFLRVGVIAALAASVWQAFPSGDGQGLNIVRYQPATLAAMEGLFKTEPNAPLVIIGQPNTAEQKLDNPIHVPGALGFLTYKRWGAEVKGLDAFPREQWPDNIPLLYYSYHIMVGLGTIFIALMFGAAVLLWRGKLERSPWMLWLLDAQLSVSLHRQHGGLDDGGAGAAALAGLWIDAHGGRGFDARFGGQRLVHAARFYGDVHGAFDALSVFDVARDRARPATSQWPCRKLKPQMNTDEHR